MFKLYVFFLVSVVCYVQCVPVKTVSQSSASQQSLHLNVNNSTEAVNYHLTPIINELGNIDEEINEELDAILPYINFLFDLFSHGDVQENECLDSMVIQLVPDKFEKEAAVTSKNQQNPEEKSKTPAIEDAKASTA